MKTTLTKLSVVLSCAFFILFILISCGKEEDFGCAEKFCSEPIIENSLLNIELISQDLQVPTAKYTALVKVDLWESTGLTPVSGIRLEDIGLLDNGEDRSEFESAENLSIEAGSFDFDVMLLVDLSGSITEADILPILKEALAAFVNISLYSPTDEQINGTLNVGLFYFDGDPDIVQLQGFTTDKELLLSKIESIDASLTRDNSTNLYGGVIEGVNKLSERLKSSNLLANVGSLIVFTDGKDRAGIKTKIEAVNSINNLKEGNQYADVYTVGLGGEIDETVLAEIGPDGFYYANDIDNLIPEFSELAQNVNSEVKSYYKLEYCTPRRGGSAQIEIEFSYQNKYARLITCLNADCIHDDCR